MARLATEKIYSVPFYLPFIGPSSIHVALKETKTGLRPDIKSATLNGKGLHWYNKDIYVQALEEIDTYIANL